MIPPFGPDEEIVSKLRPTNSSCKLLKSTITIKYEVD